MRDFVYLGAVILVVLWAIGFIGFHAGPVTHILLVIALIAIVFRVISGKGTRG